MLRAPFLYPRNSYDLDMTFKSFVEQYTADMQTRIKENTWATKEHIMGVQTKSWTDYAAKPR